MKATSLFPARFASTLRAALYVAVCSGLTVSPGAMAAPKPKKKKETVPVFPSTRHSAPRESMKTDNGMNPEETDSKTADQSRHQIRATLGLVSGLSYVGSPVFAYGGDYVRTMRPDLDLVAGLLRWNNVYSDSNFSIDHAVTTFDGGVEYRLPLGAAKDSAFMIKGVGRLGLAISSAATQDVVIGQPENTSTTVTAFAASIGGTLVYTKDRMQFGVELRKPIYFAKLQDAGTFAYLLGTATFSL